MKLGATWPTASPRQRATWATPSPTRRPRTALSVAGSILDRVSELATLAKDPTKNTTDLANYNDEFYVAAGQSS